MESPAGQLDICGNFSVTYLQLDDAHFFPISMMDILMSMALIEAWICPPANSLAQKLF